MAPVSVVREASLTGTALRPPDSEIEPLVRRLAGVYRRGITPAERRRRESFAMRAMATIRRGDYHVLTEAMPEYPAQFRPIPFPPPAVFAKGRLELLETSMVAIVGTRRCTPYGLESARRIAAGLADAGVTVVSGLALGIDGAAHQAAGAARTVAVLGCGLDVSYPPRHRDLQREIGRHGLLLTEQLPGAPAASFHFPRRNRLIAALGRGVVVVEAPFRSGTMGTVQNALELGRPVFAVPGPIGARTSAGTNELIQDGGLLVTDSREILEILGLEVPAAGARSAESAPAELHGVGLALWRALSPEPRHVDDLAAGLGLEAYQVLASLLALEIQGHTRQVPGMRFVRATPDD